MGNPQGAEAETREVVAIRFTPSELRFIDDCARRYMLTRSMLIRTAIFAGLDRYDADLTPTELKVVEQRANETGLRPAEVISAAVRHSLKDPLFVASVE